MGKVAAVLVPPWFKRHVPPGCIPFLHPYVLCCVNSLPQRRSRSAVPAACDPFTHLEAVISCCSTLPCWPYTLLHPRLCAAAPGSTHSVFSMCVDASGHPWWAPRVLASNSYPLPATKTTRLCISAEDASLPDSTRACSALCVISCFRVCAALLPRAVPEGALCPLD